jgi:hypothetical protein
MQRKITKFQTMIVTLSNFTMLHKNKLKLFSLISMKLLKTQLTYHSLIKTIIMIQVRRIANLKKKQTYLKVNPHHQFSFLMSIILLL